jgi:hypothetical protein
MGTRTRARVCVVWCACCVRGKRRLGRGKFLSSQPTHIHPPRTRRNVKAEKADLASLRARSMNCSSSASMKRSFPMRPRHWRVCACVLAKRDQLVSLALHIYVRVSLCVRAHTTQPPSPHSPFPPPSPFFFSSVFPFFPRLPATYCDGVAEGLESVRPPDRHVHCLWWSLCVCGGDRHDEREGKANNNNNNNN